MNKLSVLLKSFACSFTVYTLHGKVLKVEEDMTLTLEVAGLWTAGTALPYSTFNPEWKGGGNTSKVVCSRSAAKDKTVSEGIVEEEKGSTQGLACAWKATLRL